MKKKHLWYYLSLMIIYLIGVLLLTMFQFNKQLQMTIFVMLAFFYVGLGILHHTLHHTITAKIVVEYVGVATFGIAIAFFILQTIV